MSKFNSADNIGEMVAEFPKTADVLKEYKIDYCCGGNRPLATALQEQGLDETEVLGKINALYEKFAQDLGAKGKDWREASTDRLITQLLNKHHAYLWAELPKIAGLVVTILRVHGINHPELATVHKLFNTLKTELESHLSKEETIQYLAISKFAETNVAADLHQAIAIIDELKDEHVKAGDLLKAIRAAANDFEIPADGCETYELTYRKLQEMESDLFQHIHLENNILFPRLLGLEDA